LLGVAKACSCLLLPPWLEDEYMYDRYGYSSGSDEMDEDIHTVRSCSSSERGDDDEEVQELLADIAAISEDLHFLESDSRQDERELQHLLMPFLP